MDCRLDRSYRTRIANSILAGLIFPAVFIAQLYAGSPLPADEVTEIWTIGKPDGSSIEFAPGSKPKINFLVGQSTPEKDFPANQIGSVSPDSKSPSGESPYTISFDLKQKPAGAYELVLDLIFPAAAPSHLKIQVNQKTGIFPFLPEPKKDVDSNEANAMLLARQHLVLQIEASWLRLQGNRITLIPLGIGGIEYDAVSLRKARPSGDGGIGALVLEPTVFYRKQDGKLVETCRLIVPFKKGFVKGSATVQVGNFKTSKALLAPGYDFGSLMETVEIEPPAGSATATLTANLDGRTQRAKQPFTPAKQWKVYICPMIHNDVGYTDIQPQVNELDTRNTDTVLDILDTYPFYKFNFETGWLVDNFLDSRPSGERQRFLERARQRRLGLNAFYLNLLTGLCSGEELYRAVYFAYRMHKENGSNFSFASLTDAPSHTWFLPSLLTDVGIKVFANGSNQTRAPILQFSNLNEDSPFYWEGMNGERIMMWYSRSYAQLRRLTAPTFTSRVSSYEYLQRAVPQFLLRYLRQDYVPDAVMIYGAYVDNSAIPKTAEAPLIARWNQEYEFPRLIVATDGEYFHYVSNHFAGRLPVFRGDAGAYWEDGAGSTSRTTKLDRHTHQLLPTAETVASFATLFEPRNRYPEEKFRSAWNNTLFYDEHTWGAYNSTRQPDREFVTRQWEIKKSYATRANLDARKLLTRSLNRLFQQMRVKGDTIFAMNMENWIRSAPVEVEIDDGHYLFDLSSQKPVPLDVVFKKDGWRRVRFLAGDVPAMGYKGYEIRSLPPSAQDSHESQKQEGATMENQYYRAEIDPASGAIKSLYDKTAGKELVDEASPYKLNQYLYVSGGSDTLIIDNVYGRPLPDLIVDSPSSARIVENVKTPLGQRITVEASARNTPKITSEYLLYDNLKRLDIRNRFEKAEVRDHEAVYFAFPFAAAKPVLEYQIQNGWVRPNEDQLPGAAREWFTTQNLVHVRDGDFSIAWASPDAPLMTLEDINRGKWPRHLDIKNGYIFSYPLNNYWFTNYKAAQGGKFSFSYAITSGNGLGRQTLARFDADTRQPIFAYPLLSTFSASVEGKGRPLSAAQASLMSLDDPNTQFVVFKAAEDGDGYILRFREIAGHSGTAELHFPTLQIKEAYLCNGVEVNKQKLESTQNSVIVPYTQNEYVTVRLRAEGALGK